VLIKEFEKYLIEMENRAIEKIVTVDEEFISKIEAMDSDLGSIKHNIVKSSKGLEGEDTLKHLIIHLSKHLEEKYYAQLSDIKQESSELTKLTLTAIVKS
jgi:hypothetical protein